MKTSRVALLACGLLSSSSAALAAPPGVNGAYRLVSVDGGGQKIVIADVVKAIAARGEVVFNFDGDSVSFGMWTANKRGDAEHPGQTLVSLCRGEAIIMPSWSGSTFVLGSKVQSLGWSSAVHITKSVEGSKTKLLDWGREGKCSFSLDRSRFTVAVVSSDSAGAASITIKYDKGLMHLERTQPMETLDAEEIAKSLAL